MISVDTLQKDIDTIIQTAATKEAELLDSLKKGVDDPKQTIDDYIQTRDKRLLATSLRQQFQGLVDQANEIIILDGSVSSFIN